MPRRAIHRHDQNVSQSRPGALRWSDPRSELLSDFDFLGELGRGGSAIVYHAHERLLGRDVAIKVVRPTALEQGETLAGIQHEARTVARLEHPNIVPLYGARSLSDGRIALIMRFVPGRTLRDALDERGAFDAADIERVVADIASALAHAHRQGVIHRDVKPENIFLDANSGAALLADFGIASSLETDPGAEGLSAVGTPTYMAPEQIDGRSPIDGRCDLYSLGLVAWEMCTGRRPWDGFELSAVLFKQQHEDLALVDAIRSDLPEQIVYVIDGLLRKNPDERFASADVLLSQLDLPVPPAKWRKWHAARLERFIDEARERETADASDVAERAGALETIRFDGQRELPPMALPPEREPLPPGVLDVDDVNGAPTRDALMTPRRIRRASELAAFSDEEARSRARGSAWRWVAAAALIVGASVAAGMVWRGRMRDDARVSASAAALTDRSAIELKVAHRDSAAPLSAPSSDSLKSPAAVDSTPVVAAAPSAVDASSAVQGGEVAHPAKAEPPTPKRDSVRATAEVPTTKTAVAPPPAPVPSKVKTEAVVTAPSTSVANTMRDSDVAPVVVSFAVDRPTLAVGGRHACALDTRGLAHCWGSDDHGQLGGGDLAGVPGFTQIAAGISHSCALTRFDEVYCWGDNDRGALGDGSTASRDKPARIAGAWALRSVRAGAAHTCGLTREGEAVCWGSNAFGQTGTSAASAQLAPARVNGGTIFGTIATGWQHTCAIALDGTLYCWGSNAMGQLGDGSRTDHRTPTKVAATERFIAVAAGASHTCAVTLERQVMCWGRGAAAGSVGADRAEPTMVPGLSGVTVIAAGGAHTCARTSGSQTLCWGRNTYGQLGDGGSTDRSSPVVVAGGLSFVALQASGSNTCGTTAAGERWCWGSNLDGQLGDGTHANQSHPVRVTASQ